MQFPPFPPQPFAPLNTGWQCPKCKAIYSPLVQMCGKCSMNNDPFKLPNQVPSPFVPPPTPFPTGPSPSAPWPPYTITTGGKATSNGNFGFLWNSGCGSPNANT